MQGGDADLTAPITPVRLTRIASRDTTGVMAAVAQLVEPSVVVRVVVGSSPISRPIHVLK